MPPSIILEVLNILEDEIELREETRGLEQARKALEVDDYGKKADALSTTQDDLTERVGEVINKIIALENGEAQFKKELGLLTMVRGVMDEAKDILAKPSTGPDAIAAETEAIELLMQAKRINPNGGGGGGGSSPGGGGGGTTEQSALASLGAGDDRDASIEKREIDQSTGLSGRKVPEEFRGGLDRYFNRIEGGGGD